MFEDFLRPRNTNERGHMLPTTIAALSMLIMGGTLVMAALHKWGVL